MTCKIPVAFIKLHTTYYPPVGKKYKNELTMNSSIKIRCSDEFIVCQFNIFSQQLYLLYYLSTLQGTTALRIALRITYLL